MNRTSGLILTLILSFTALLLMQAAWVAPGSSQATNPSLQATFITPVDMNKAKVAAKFGNRTHPVTGKSVLHTGLDLASRQGEAVVAASSGTVVKATFDANRGNHVVIKHDDTYSTSYSHLNSLAVRAGQVIESGGLVGTVGSTGLSTEPHLHFEVLKNGKAVDPVDYLPQ